ncbi:hypothetical protein [Thermococcus stetteri]|uniref:hypothetical protein n=1 Tax=Thermococcus stetteri TaxID=49900 RepID=UPI001AE31E69|nr:hypothetical protein [Thermococcus stetteri]MBP1911472.1 hypothetical protein [Thermococcus stetteri]
MYVFGLWVDDLLILAIGGSTLLSLLLNNETLSIASGLLFWIFLPTSLFGRKIKLEDGRLEIEWGWPLRLIRENVELGEVREIVDLESADRLPPIRYYKKRAVLFTVLLVSVGILGLKKKPDWAFTWLGWIYWGILPLLSFVFPERRILITVSSFLVGLLVSLYVVSIGMENPWYYLAVGILMGDPGECGTLQNPVCNPRNRQGDVLYRRKL